MSECIFCKIVAGELPSHKIFEDENSIAFLDIHPAVEGFTVIIPKTHSRTLWEMPKHDYQTLMSTVHKVSNHMLEVFGSERVGMKVEGLEVEHTHVKIFPFSTSEEFRANGDMNAEPDHQHLSEVAERLKVS